MGIEFFFFCKMLRSGLVLRKRALCATASSSHATRSSTKLRSTRAAAFAVSLRQPRRCFRCSPGVARVAGGSEAFVADLRSKNINDWTIDDICAFIDHFGPKDSDTCYLSAYKSILEQQRINGKMLTALHVQENVGVRGGARQFSLFELVAEWIEANEKQKAPESSDLALRALSDEAWEHALRNATLLSQHFSYTGKSFE